MSMVVNVYTNNDFKQLEIVTILTTKFFDMLRYWWDKHFIAEAKDTFKNALKLIDDGFPTFDDTIGMRILDCVNTLMYTIVKHFVGTLSNIIIIFKNI